MFKKILKWTFLILLAVFIVIQFFRPAKNKSNEEMPYAIEKKYPVPDSVMQVLKVACYDCHSNNTRYPWYAEIQPVRWWLDGHIKDGKRGLNFDEFLTYRIFKQYRRFEDINKLVDENEMPIHSYLWIHKDAKMDEGRKQLIANWANAMRDSIKANYPEDSLKRPQPKGK